LVSTFSLLLLNSLTNKTGQTADYFITGSRERTRAAPFELIKI